MAYSKFQNLDEVLTKFSLRVKSAVLFTDCQSKSPSAWLSESIKLLGHFSFFTEKERSERIVNPILYELSANNQFRVTIYSGRELNVSVAEGLNGECDFLMGFDTVPQVVQAPLFSVVEAKKQDLDYGSAQCIAQMVGAARFNLVRGFPIKKIYGCSTNAIEWRFFSLEENVLTFHTSQFMVSDLGNLLGFMQCIFDEFKRENNIQ